MGVTLICPNLGCGRIIVVPDSARGQIVRCAHCNQPFLVPNGAGVPEPASTPPDEDGNGSSRKSR
ncbi:MAG: hypothetical protein JXO22_06855 [Phycisphaerae bacterium]|nr:hypothetical protein [Phycisphaerae bacterium]